MAPLTISSPSYLDDKSTTIPGLSVSSLELDQRSTDSLLSRTVKDGAALLKRTVTTSTYVPCAGCTSPKAINNTAFFALFALIGASLVLGSLWFFFWAKNGGFQFQEGDFEDWKSTVMRRKGPDGKTLSNATRSTKLGGGSVVHKQAKWAAKTVIAKDEKGRKGILGKRGFGGSHSVYYSDDFTNYDGPDRRNEMSEISSEPDYYHDRNARARDVETGHGKRYKDRDMQHYRTERVARVGGMNKTAEGSHFDSNGSDVTSERSTEPLVRNKAKNARTVELERKANDEAAKMERQWRREAERAAASLAKEQTQRPAQKPTARTPSPTKRNPSPAKRQTSRTPSPTKKQPQRRDYSFSKGEETMSQPSSSDRRTSNSYYDNYRPNAAATATKTERRVPGAFETGRAGRGGRDVMAGYRRGRGEMSDEED